MFSLKPANGVTMEQCKDCKDGEHDNYTDDVELAVIRDPETLKVISRKNLCSEHWEMYLDDGYLVDAT